MIKVNVYEDCKVPVGVQNEVVNVYDVDYNKVINKPQINGVELIGNKTSAELDIKEDLNYVHTQGIASNKWVIVHNLNKYPSVMIVDSAGSVVTGDCEYIDLNIVECTFTGEFSGKAFLN